MKTVKAYLYPIILEVQIPDPEIFNLRKRVVYARPIKVYQGIDNPVQIVVSNQDNKPYDLTGYSLILDIQDTVNQTVIQSYTVEFDDVTRGRGLVVFDRATLDQLDRRYYKITLKKVNLETEQAEPVYIDDNYGVPLDLEVLPAYFDAP